MEAPGLIGANFGIRLASNAPNRAFIGQSPDTHRNMNLFATAARLDRLEPDRPDTDRAPPTVPDERAGKGAFAANLRSRLPDATAARPAGQDHGASSATSETAPATPETTALAPDAASAAPGLNEAVQIAVQVADQRSAALPETPQTPPAQPKGAPPKDTAADTASGDMPDKPQPAEPDPLHEGARAQSGPGETENAAPPTTAAPAAAPAEARVQPPVKGKTRSTEMPLSSAQVAGPARAPGNRSGASAANTPPPAAQGAAQGAPGRAETGRATAGQAPKSVAAQTQQHMPKQADAPGAAPAAQPSASPESPAPSPGVGILEPRIADQAGLAMSSAGLAAAPAPSSVAASAGPLALVSPDWPADAVAATVSALGPEGGSITIELTPEDLGRLVITVTLEGDSASVRFQTETAEAARHLADAERTLVSELARNGLTLAGHEASAERRAPQQPHGQPGRGAAKDAPAEPTAAHSARPLQGLVNLIA
jgi:flagellar hook-length control protein FliK